MSFSQLPSSSTPSQPSQVTRPLPSRSVSNSSSNTNTSPANTNRQITISVRDLELNCVGDKPPLSDISCYLTVYTGQENAASTTGQQTTNASISNTCYDLLILTDPHNASKFKLLRKTDNQYLKVQLKTLSKQRLLGSVTLSLGIFADSAAMSLDQWINLTVGSVSSDTSTGSADPSVTSKQLEGSARIKLRFIISDKCTEESTTSPTPIIAPQQQQIQQQQQQLQQQAQQAQQSEAHKDMQLLNSTLQPCVNFPISASETIYTKHDFTPFLNHEELGIDSASHHDQQRERQQQQSCDDEDANNIESRLVYTPERQRMQQENSLVFQNKFQELIEKLMETRNQSLILGVTRSLNESHRKDLEKNNLTEILKRLNESQNYLDDEDELLDIVSESYNNNSQQLQQFQQLHQKMVSGTQQQQSSQKQLINCESNQFTKKSSSTATGTSAACANTTIQSPEHHRRSNRIVDLESEIASLRLELEKKQELEKTNRDLKAQVFNAERNNETLLNQYNKAVDNYQKYFSEINEDNLALKKKLTQLEKDVETSRKTIAELRESQSTSNPQQQASVDSNSQASPVSSNEQCPQKQSEEIMQYSQLLLESQNECVQLQAKMQQMQTEIDALTAANKLASSDSSNPNPQQSENKSQAVLPPLAASQAVLKRSRSGSQLSEEDQSYFQGLLKEKALRVTQLEGEKQQLEFIASKHESNAQKLQQRISELEAAAANIAAVSNNQQTQSSQQQQLQDENTQLKAQLEESEQLRITIEDHLKKTKLAHQKKLEELESIRQSHDSPTFGFSQSIINTKWEEERMQMTTFVSELQFNAKQNQITISTLQEKNKILEFNTREYEQLRSNLKIMSQEKEQLSSDLYTITEDLLKKTTECISKTSLISSLQSDLNRLENRLETLFALRLNSPSHINNLPEKQIQQQQQQQAYYQQQQQPQYHQYQQQLKQQQQLHEQQQQQATQQNLQCSAQQTVTHAIDELDLQVSQFIARNPSPIALNRLSNSISSNSTSNNEGSVYAYGSKRVTIKLLKGRIVCRVGSGFMQIAEFVGLYRLQELLRIKQSGDFSLLSNPSTTEAELDELIQTEILNNQQAKPNAFTTYQSASAIAASQANTNPTHFTDASNPVSPNKPLHQQQLPRQRNQSPSHSPQPAQSRFPGHCTPNRLLASSSSATIPNPTTTTSSGSSMRKPLLSSQVTHLNQLQQLQIAQQQQQQQQQQLQQQQHPQGQQQNHNGSNQSQGSNYSLDLNMYHLQTSTRVPVPRSTTGSIQNAVAVGAANGALMSAQKTGNTQSNQSGLTAPVGANSSASYAMRVPSSSKIRTIVPESININNNLVSVTDFGAQMPTQPTSTTATPKKPTHGNSNINNNNENNIPPNADRIFKPYTKSTHSQMSPFKATSSTGFNNGQGSINHNLPPTYSASKQLASNSSSYQK